jgi:protein O-mannosyl-transferase
MNPSPAPRPHPVLFPLIVALLTFAAFSPALRGDFVNWDDDLNFLNNPHYRGLGATQLRWMWTSFFSGHYHPLTWMTLGLDFAIWGMNPVGYHLTNLLLHAANAALLYFVLAALLRLAGRPDVRWPAAIGALFHAVHPLRVESVAWITERRDVLCGFFALACVLAYLRHVEADNHGKPDRRWLVLSLVAFSASLLSKALSIALPALLLILDIYPLGRFRPGARRRILLEKVPYALLSCLDAGAMLLAMRDISAVHSVAHYNVFQRGAQAAYGLCFYLLKTAWPMRLAPLYKIDAELRPWDAVYLASMAGAVGVTLLLLLRRRRWPAALAAWAGYVALVFPVLGVAVTGMQIAADRYTYLALMPASVLAAFAAERALRPDAVSRKWTAALAAGVLGLLSVLAFRQAGVWKDSLTLWTREIELDSACAIGWQNRAYARHERGDRDGAIADYSASISLDPSYVRPWYNRGVLLALRGDHERAIVDFTEAIRRDPAHGDAYSARAVSLLKRGDLQGAIADYSRALEIDPSSAEMLRRRGIARSMAGDVRGALDDLGAALRRNPDPGTYVMRASMQGMAGNLQGAIADFTEALRLKPDYPDAYARRGIARLEASDPQGAAQDFARALEIAPPDWPQRRQIELYLLKARSP